MHADDPPIHLSAQRTSERPRALPTDCTVTRMIDGGPDLGTGPGDPFGVNVSTVQPLLPPLITARSPGNASAPPLSRARDTSLGLSCRWAAALARSSSRTWRS